MLIIDIAAGIVLGYVTIMALPDLMAIIMRIARLLIAAIDALMATIITGLIAPARGQASRLRWSEGASVPAPAAEKRRRGTKHLNTRQA
jgi:hypothetical protein